MDDPGRIRALLVELHEAYERMLRTASARLKVATDRRESRMNARARGLAALRLDRDRLLYENTELRHQIEALKMTPAEIEAAYALLEKLRAANAQPAVESEDGED